MTVIEKWARGARDIGAQEQAAFCDVDNVLTCGDILLAADCIARVREEAQRQEAIVQAGRTRRHPGFVIDFEAEIEALRALAARIGEAGDG